ncbi:transporter [Ancylomarina longa]|uniref:Transporter n=1 Tax=Ancylomarina longa TaxID=2487017 RepID=A0A434AUS7_9BACT|nr:transporter [Ancylomarina longa]RUT78192.1 transporter [Ancylomarina longa]
MNIKPILFAALRVVLYAIPVAISALIIKSDAGVIVDGMKFSESSSTEWMQEIYLLLTSMVFIAAGIVSKKHKAISYLMGGGALVALIREWDAYFDQIYHGAWLPFAVVILLITIVLVYKKRDQLLENLEDFFNTPAFGTFIAGFLCVFVFSRLFGTKKVWRAVFEVGQLEPMQRWVKNAVEEGSELFGYTLLFIAAIEFFVFVKRKVKNKIAE